jgi:hypothetical protein
MSRMPLALPIAGTLLALALGVYLRSFALIFLGLALFCLVPIKLGRLATAATVAASGFATLMVIELAFTVFLPPEPRAFWNKGDRVPNVRASDIGRVTRPGTYAVHRVLLDGRTLYAVTYTVGEDGFRVTPGDWNVGARRINLLGGSFAFGDGLEDDETLAYHLGQKLGVATRNFGISGGGPHEALAILESDRDTEGAVNVLLTAAWHAPRVVCLEHWTGGAPRYRFDESGAIVRDGFCPERYTARAAQALRNHSRVVGVMAEAFDVLRRNSISNGAQLDLYVAVIERIAALSRERGQALVVAYIGTEELHDVPLDNAALIRRLEAAGAIVVDVSLAPSSRQLSPDYYIREIDTCGEPAADPYCHPTALANEHRARLLAPVLEAILTQPADADGAPQADLSSGSRPSERAAGRPATVN